MKHLVYVWNGLGWTLDNSYNAIVRAGPWDDNAQVAAAICKAEEEALAEGYEPGYVTNRVRIVEVPYPAEVP